MNTNYGFDNLPKREVEPTIEDPSLQAGLATAISSKYYVGWRLISTTGDTHMSSTIALVFKEEILRVIRDHDKKETPNGFEIEFGTSFVGKLYC